MKFSVIVPTYNEQDFIEDCLKSIRGQDFERSQFEIIVSDSTSTDGTIELARRYADIVVVDERRGIAHGRNSGASKAQGDILLFVDADVNLHKGFLRQISETFVDGVVGMTGIASPLDGNLFQRFVYRGTYMLVRVFDTLHLPLYPGLCVAYRRNAFERVRGFREDFGVVEDLDLSKRISRLGKCIANSKARAYVSTRRLKSRGFSTVLFHIYNDLRYLLTGKAAKFYPKSEELQSWRDLWRLNKSQ